MSDWRKIAEARGLEISEDEAARIARTLEALETAFRPLAAAIPEDVEPAVTFRAEEEQA